MVPRNSRTVWPAILDAVAIALFASGCADPSREPETPSKPEPLRLAAASDLRDVMPALTRRFTDVTGIDVVASFGASGQLAEQIKAGAPFDVFLAANMRYVEELAERRLVRPGSVLPYAHGTLVLAVHRGAGAAIAGLADLRRPDVKRIALANPDFAPYGAAGKQALERAGLWTDLEPRIVQAESVRQALQYVQSGNAEAGLVGKAIARVPEVRVVEVDPALYAQIIQGVGIVAGSRRPTDAEAFSEFLRGAEGRTILTDAGFQLP